MVRGASSSRASFHQQRGRRTPAADEAVGALLPSSRRSATWNHEALTINLRGGSNSDPLLATADDDALPERSKDSVPSTSETITQKQPPNESLSGSPTWQVKDEAVFSHPKQFKVLSSKMGTAFFRNRDPWERYSVGRHTTNRFREQQVQQMQEQQTQLQELSRSSTEEPLTVHGAPKQIPVFFSLVSTLWSSATRTNFWSLYALALLGSSAGFYVFFYFITIGYATGIFLPVAVALMRTLSATSKSTLKLPWSTLLHSVLVIVWSLRMLGFLVWREYIAWPALHEKVMQVASPSVTIQILCWLFYSLLYVCMIAPCWFRLEAATAASVLTTLDEIIPSSTKQQLPRRRSSSILTWSLILQVAGLVLESVADWQKSAFKTKAAAQSVPSSLASSSRELELSATEIMERDDTADNATSIFRASQWCHEGVWKYSTYPNYAGEWLFWLGTFLGGLPWDNGAAVSAGTLGMQFLTMTLGLLFITVVLRGSAGYQTRQHFEKYGQDPEFIKFRQTHSIFGPKVPNVDWASIIDRLKKFRRLLQKTRLLEEAKRSDDEEPADKEEGEAPAQEFL